MNDKTLSKTRCIYIIVTAATIEELEKKVNDIIEQGWLTEGFVNGGWQLVGGVIFDGQNYHQAMMYCPEASGARKAKKSKKKKKR